MTFKNLLLHEQEAISGMSRILDKKRPEKHLFGVPPKFALFLLYSEIIDCTTFFQLHLTAAKHKAQSKFSLLR